MASYGAMPGSLQFPPQKIDGSDMFGKSPAMPTNRQRMNLGAICMIFTVPWALFCFVYCAVSTSFHYYHPMTCYFIVAASLVLVCCTGIVHYDSRRHRSETARKPSWIGFLFVTCLINFFAAVVLGYGNFTSLTVPEHDREMLNTYVGVDPSQKRGTQMLDAGLINFAEGTYLDIPKSMGFKDAEMHCVVPIAIGGATLASYDFWAVGTGCCSGDAADFHCPGFSDPNRRSGVRVMNDNDLTYYRLAVQQAEAAYDIQAEHPIFLTWSADPTAELQGYEERLWGRISQGVMYACLIQALLVGIAAYRQVPPSS